jgi:hypothetical protein
MNLVCSWGGVGTTAMLECLSSVEGYSCNPAHGYINPLKHPLSPPPQAERAVFLIGCPYDSLLSLFRRGFDRLHYVNVNGLFPPNVPYPHGNLWDLTCQKFGLREDRPGVWVNREGEYADRCGALDWLEERKAERAHAEQLVNDLANEAYRDLADYASKGKDLFRRYEQLDNWTRGASYPILLVRYEALWNKLDKVLEFLQLPVEHRSRFPKRKPRETDFQGLDPALVSGLMDIYGELAHRVSGLRGLSLIRPSDR